MPTPTNSDLCIIIPTYNNAGTVRRVVDDAMQSGLKVLVVNDGSTDDTLHRLADLDGIELVTYADNRGKGHALREGFKRARQMGYKYAITMDADGQHFAADIPAFLQIHEQHPDALIVGSRNLQSANMPGKNTFANKFSNFWFHVQTLQYLPDTQTGFRLYPLNAYGSLWWITSRYEAELELLVSAAWKGVKIIDVPIDVYYPPQGQRVSHFRPAYDFTRISILNTVLCLLAIGYGYPRMMFQRFCSMFQ